MAKAAKERSVKTIADMILSDSSYQHNLSTYFRDMIEAWTIALRNNAEPKDVNWTARENRFEEIKTKYRPETMRVFQEVFAEIFLLSHQVMGDHIGELYGHLEINSKGLKQIFTPYNLAKLMSEMTFSSSETEALIQQQGFIDLNEPACGAGATIIAYAETMRKNGFDPSKELRVIAQDIDSHCVNMCYVQMRMYEIPAAVIHGNTITMENFNAMMTPEYVIQGMR